MGELDGKDADTPGGTMNQNGLSGGEVRVIDASVLKAISQIIRHSLLGTSL